MEQWTMNRASLLNDGWRFWLDEQCREALPVTQVDWQPVELPHDWQIWHVSNLYQDGTGWYRRTLFYQPRAGRRLALYFEGVYMDTTVFVNGAAAGEWKNGYTSFHLDVTDLLRPGENELLVRCLLRHPNSRWYSGAGIYRDVWLWEMPEEHLLPHSLYVAPKEQPDGTWTVLVQAELGRTGARRGNDDGAQVVFLLRDPLGAEVEHHVLPAGRGTPVSQEDASDYVQGEREIVAVWDAFRLERPILWDTDAPRCYRMEAMLVRRGMVTDRLESAFGFRTVELHPDRGLLLNHRPLTLHGVCLHHDLGCLGSAFSQAAAERQLRIMREMGVNALRTAHNPPAEGVMELADRYGLLVVSEGFDAWNTPKNPYDYARFFQSWEARDVASWVRRDRNHPSLLLWSIGNEIYDTHAGPQGLETMRRLMAQVQAQDFWGNGAVTLGSNYMAWENTQRCAEELTVIGYNYGEALYSHHHAAHPNWVIYGSETGSLVQSRGIYHFPLRQSVLVDDDQQCSSLGNSRTRWGSDGVAACLRADLEHPYT
ncbi:MAG: glycoside hydrolase family 2, partial [Clostridiales bacterium]|nr:glycoside hydrolase family 2 [Clostridiales bacterium]